MADPARDVFKVDVLEEPGITVSDRCQSQAAHQPRTVPVVRLADRCRNKETRQEQANRHTKDRQPAAGGAAQAGSRESGTTA